MSYDHERSEKAYNENAIFFQYCKNNHTNDCLIHAVNAAVGDALFTCKEQVMRLMEVRGKRSKKKTIGLKA